MNLQAKIVAKVDRHPHSGIASLELLGFAVMSPRSRFTNRLLYDQMVSRPKSIIFQVLHSPRSFRLEWPLTFDAAQDESFACDRLFSKPHEGTC